MPVKATILRKPAKKGEPFDLGVFSFVALPNVGDRVVMFVRDADGMGGESTPYDVVGVIHHIEAGRPPSVAVHVE